MMLAERRLELETITKRFGGFTAIAPLDLAVDQGQLIALLGPAGAGKTTLLRLIAGLERPTSGAVRFDGLDVTALPPQRRDVAMVFQSPALYPHLSVQRNLALPMRAQRIPRNAIVRRVDEVIERLGLTSVRRCKPRRLSPREYQLASIGRAAVRDAKAFLFDEPLTPFAADERAAMRRELRAIHEELRATTLLATRHPAHALALADRVAVMNQGRVVQCDAPQALRDRPLDLFVAKLIGAEMLFLDASLHDGASVRLAGSDCRIHISDAGARPVDPDRITLSVQREQVRLDERGVPVSIDPAGCRWYDATSGQTLPWRALHTG